MPSRRKAKKLEMRRRIGELDVVDIAKLVGIGIQLFNVLKAAAEQPAADPNQPAIDNIVDADAQVVSSKLKN